MANLTSAINVNVDSTTKKEATKILNDLGLNMSTAINIYLKQIVKRKGIPFEITDGVPSKKLIKAIKEADKIAKDPNRKGYRNVDKLVEDLLD